MLIFCLFKILCSNVNQNTTFHPNLSSDLRCILFVLLAVENYPTNNEKSHFVNNMFGKVPILQIKLK